MLAYAGRMRRSIRIAAGLRTVILLEYSVAALAIAASVWVAVATYARPVGCVDTCFEPVMDLVVGLLGIVLLVVLAAVALIFATVWERHQARSASPPVTGHGWSIAKGTALSAAGFLVAVLVAVFLFVPRLT